MKATIVLLALMALKAEAFPINTGQMGAVKSLSGQNFSTVESEPQPEGPKEDSTGDRKYPSILPNVDPYPGNTDGTLNRNPKQPHPLNPSAPVYPPLPPIPGVPRSQPAPTRMDPRVEIPLDEFIGVGQLSEEMDADGLGNDAVYLYRVSNPEVFVVIDKDTQTITVRSPETEATQQSGEVTRYVSTGGGWKNPVDPTSGQPDEPYCADNVTPNVTNLFIPATEGQTLFKNKRSNRFTSANGVGVAMPYAIHVIGHGGIFLHQVPSGKMADGRRYSDLLGDNVSGGCIRLDAEMAPWLYDLAKKHGGIQLTIQGTSPAKCRQAQRRQPQQQYPRQQRPKTLGDFFRDFF
ncbi:MAG: L,D-transpeptidase [Bdellovibrionales bacterium]|nr:L,D-transpeptidase [Bdellovibrionales bacterium]